MRLFIRGSYADASDCAVFPVAVNKNNESLTKKNDQLDQEMQRLKEKLNTSWRNYVIVGGLCGTIGGCIGALGHKWYLDNILKPTIPPGVPDFQKTYTVNNLYTPTPNPSTKLITNNELIASVIPKSNTPPKTKKENIDIISLQQKFVGLWDQDVGIGASFQWKFNSNGTLETGPNSVMMTTVGTWEVNGNQLCRYSGTINYTYEFSDNGNNLILHSAGYPLNIVLIKHV
ncbi:MAG TPA: hypothetical protein VMY59_00435 [Candidatus Thermoplasmatota archaeon]|nr:hypothetical protein [Candidatus Thermoplasmatota archaeon]